MLDRGFVSLVRTRGALVTVTLEMKVEALFKGILELKEQVLIRVTTVESEGPGYGGHREGPVYRCPRARSGNPGCGDPYS